MPKVSVVIPHKGKNTTLDLCLGALRKQSFARNLFEIIIVQNDRELPWPGVNLQENESLILHPDGFSYAARNFGVRNAKGSIIAFTDSDTIPAPEWITEGVNALERGADIVAGAIDLICIGSPNSWGNSHDLNYAFNQEKNARLGVSVTANTFVRRALFESVGYFDERLESGGDFAWCRNATHLGAQLAFAKQSRVSHPTRNSFRDQLQKAVRTTTPVKYVNNPFYWILDSSRRLQILPAGSKLPKKNKSLVSRAVLMRLLLICVRAGSMTLFLALRLFGRKV